MSLSDDKPLRIGIVGASTLVGKDIAQILEDRALPTPVEEVRLLDDLSHAGTLAEAGGEPVVIQGLDAESFQRLQLVFFACEESFAARHWPAAQRADAVVVDLSGALAQVRGAYAWIPSLEATYAPAGSRDTSLFYSPGSAAIVACTAAAAFRRFRVRRMAAVFLQPVSEHGQAGIDELEGQTAKLLSLQPISRELLDEQIAFNLLDRYGESSRVSLDDTRAALARDVAAYLGKEISAPAIEIIQAPVFYSFGFSIYVELEEGWGLQDIELALIAAGFSVLGPGSPAVSNVSVAGSSELRIGSIRRNGSVETGYWLWGAVDNVRLAADNAVRIAEKILATR